MCLWGFGLSLFVSHPASAQEATKSPTTESKGQSQTPIKVNPKGAGFEVLLPGQPEHSVVPIKSKAGNSVDQQQYLTRFPDGALLISYQPSDLEQLADAKGLEKAFDEVRDGQAKSYSGKILLNKKLQIPGAVTAREVRITMPAAGGEYRARFFIGNQNFYQVIAIGTPEFVKSQQVQQIFDSFRFTSATTQQESQFKPKSADFKYATEFGRFQMKFHNKPEYFRGGVELTSGEIMARHLYVSGQAGEKLAVGFMDIPDMYWKMTETESKETLIKSLANGLAKDFQGTLTEFKPVENSKDLTYDFVIKSEQPDLNVLGFLVLRDRRCYQVMGIGSPEFIEASLLDSNLRAFQLSPR